MHFRFRLIFALACLLPFPALAASGAVLFPAMDMTKEHVRGNAAAGVSIVTYVDFQAVSNRNQEALFRQLRARYHDQINQVYRPYPLAIHPLAEPLAVAAECVAQRKGERAFWRFYDAAMKRIREGVTDSKIPRIMALNWRITEHDYNLCVRDLPAQIQASVDAGAALTLHGAPSFVIVNNHTGDYAIITGVVPMAYFTAVIDPMLEDNTVFEPKVSQAKQFMSRILTKGIWSKKNAFNPSSAKDIYTFNLTANTYTFRIVSTDRGNDAEAGRWYLEEKADGMHLLLKPTDKLPCRALACDSILEYDNEYDKLFVTSNGLKLTLDHQTK